MWQVRIYDNDGFYFAHATFMSKQVADSYNAKLTDWHTEVVYV